MIPSAHLDTFARDNLPPQIAMAGRSCSTCRSCNYPDRLNCVSELLDRWIAAGDGDRACLISPAEELTYAQTRRAREPHRQCADARSRPACPGNRVLLRAPNSPMMVAAYLAVIKAGGVVVATMPLLRAKEIAYPLSKAKIRLALCDHRLADEMEKARALAPRPRTRRLLGRRSRPTALEALMQKPGYENFTACDTASDDVCLIGFTSGTTGEPKGTMHFHRDLLATCDSYGRHVLRAASHRPLHRLAAARLHVRARRAGAVSAARRRIDRAAGEGDAGRSAGRHRQASRDDLLHGADRLSRDARQTRRARHLLAAQTAFRPAKPCRRPPSTRGRRRPGIKILDGIGATEMLHIFIGSPQERHPPRRDRPAGARLRGARGRRRWPRTAARHDRHGSRCAGRPAAAISPTSASAQYVQNGWNITGDTYLMDADGYFWYQARSDDMIVSAGYNIAGPEVEAALLDASGGGRMRRGRRARR